MTKRGFHRFSLLLAVFLMVFITVAPAFARAGGGGGKGKGGAGFLALLVYAIYYVFWKFTVTVKRLGASSLIRTLEETDRGWKKEDIERRVEEAYFKIQEAWTHNDLGPVRNLLSHRLLRNWESMIQSFKNKGHRNVLEQIDLSSVEFVGISDKDGHLSDRVYILVHGSMVDYMIEEKSGLTILRKGEESESDAMKNAGFCELWEFTRNESGEWILDSVSEDTGILNIIFLPCSSTDQRYFEFLGRRT